MTSNLKIAMFLALTFLVGVFCYNYYSMTKQIKENNKTIEFLQGQNQMLGLINKANVELYEKRIYTISEQNKKISEINDQLVTNINKIKEKDKEISKKILDKTPSEANNILNDELNFVIKNIANDTKVISK